MGVRLNSLPPSGHPHPGLPPCRGKEKELNFISTLMAVDIVQLNTSSSGALKWLWITVVVVVLDQITKFAVAGAFTLHEQLPLTSWFNLTLAHNPGAAFSFLSDAGGWHRWFFTALARGVSIAIVVWLKRLPASDRWMAIALALILGGALGNVWDRITLGYVIDFLDFYVGQWHWPAFNVADSAITIGAIMLAIDAFFFAKAKDAAHTTSAQE